MAELKELVTAEDMVKEIKRELRDDFGLDIEHLNYGDTKLVRRLLNQLAAFQVKR